ncbi:protein RKD5 [Vicia villosa]|uniref:protein RKD5 n=1 Tax=Vicia villosa TaxID=3911 RepID=UPI00273C3A1C|nr:protein RKD5 [Vicia villosa]
MDSSLTNLLLFNNTVQPELMRSVHVYRGECDGEETEVEREFVFSETAPYVEMQATPIFTLLKSFACREVSQGDKNGVWLCVFAFHACNSPQFSHIPSLLLVARNPKLHAIPNLLNDLQRIYKLNPKEEHSELQDDSTMDESKGNNNEYQPAKKVSLVFEQDLNYLPYEKDESELLDDGTDFESSSGFVGKKKRAPSYHVAKITLSDLVKYFDMPIAEASKKLNVGLTVLKKKCREFGIPRWPHRKIKSLESLIQNLQEEAKHQEMEDKAAAMAALRRQKMLESEKENIEKMPFMDIRTETKRFRQDIFKRRHRARVIEKQNSAVAST